jgi:hypothetical protein
MKSHRMNYLYMNLAIVLILGLAALIGILIGIGNSEHHPNPVIATKSVGEASVRAGGLPSAPIGGSGGAINLKTLSISPGAGWKVLGKSCCEVLLGDPRKIGILGALSVPGVKSPQNFVQALVNRIAKRATNAKICGKIGNVTIPNGPRGIAVPICYTIVPQNGQSLPVFTLLLIGGVGQVGVELEVTTPDSENAFKVFVGEAKPVISTVRWKLLT